MKETKYKNKYAEFFVTKGATDENIIKEVFESNVYNKKRGFDIKKNFTVVDLGANIGSFTVYAAKKSGSGKVFAFEPEPENFKLLEKNVSLNKLTNVKLSNFAVSGKQEKLKLCLDRSNRGGHTIFKESKDFTEVNAITLKDIFDENKIERCNFLKLDIEGSEENTLSAVPPVYFEKIDLIALEYHNFASKGILKRLANILSKNYFKISVYPVNSQVGIVYAKKTMDKKFLALMNLIEVYSAHLRLLKSPQFLEECIGKIGIFIKKFNPKIYWFLKKLNFFYW